MKESEREKKVKANKREKKLEQIAEVLTWNSNGFSIGNSNFSAKQMLSTFKML